MVERKGGNETNTMPYKAEKDFELNKEEEHNRL